MHLPSYSLCVLLLCRAGRGNTSQSLITPPNFCSSCSPFLPPLPSPHPGPQHSLPLCVMQGEHQLGRRNSRPCRGRLLLVAVLHTTPSLCRLFLFSISAAPVFGSVFVFFICLYLDLYFVCICNSWPCRGQLLLVAVLHTTPSLCRLFSFFAASVFYHLGFACHVVLSFDCK